MKHDDFYLNLFKFRKSDRADPSLLFFLSDFTKKKKSKVEKMFSNLFKYLPKRKKKKKKVKGRVLGEKKLRMQGKVNDFQTIEEYRELH